MTPLAFPLPGKFQSLFDQRSHGIAAGGQEMRVVHVQALDIAKIGQAADAQALQMAGKRTGFLPQLQQPLLSQEFAANKNVFQMGVFQALADLFMVAESGLDLADKALILHPADLADGFRTCQPKNRWEKKGVPFLLGQGMIDNHLRTLAGATPGNSAHIPRVAPQLPGNDLPISFGNRFPMHGLASIFKSQHRPHHISQSAPLCR
jgi:hypothetical protein